VQAPSLPDPEVLALATSGDAILLTDDKDFGELVVRRGLEHRGVVLPQLGLGPQRQADKPLRRPLPLKRHQHLGGLRQP